MKKLKIEKINGFRYFLKDKNNNTYELHLEFHDTESIIKSGDIIYLDEYLLNQNTLLTFGKLNSKYGKEIKDDDKDIIVIESDNKRITLKRLYG